MTRRLRRFLVPALLVVTAVGLASVLAVPEETPLDDLSAEEIARIDNFVKRFQIGQQLFGSGRDEKAEEVFRDLLKEEPDAAPVHHALGTLLQFKNRPEEATAALLQAASLAPEDAVIQRDAGLDLLRHGRPGDAERYLARARQFWPEDVETLVAHAACLRATGQRDRACAAYREALAAEPLSVDARVGLASAIVAESPEEARQLVVDLSHGFADVALVHGLALAGLDRREEAVVQLANAARSSNLNGGGLVILGAATRALADEGAAEQAAVAAAVWCARTGPPPALEPSLLLAESLAALSRPGEALQALEQAETKGAPPPLVRRARLASGSLLARMGKIEDARKPLTLVADEAQPSPDRALARRTLGRITAAELALALGSAPERANDAAWAEAVAAWLSGADQAAAAHARRVGELSDPPGEFPALLLR